MNATAIANLALLGVELLKAYQEVHGRLNAIAAGEPVTLDDLPTFEAQTRERLTALKAKIEGAT